MRILESQPEAQHCKPSPAKVLGAGMSTSGNGFVLYTLNAGDQNMLPISFVSMKVEQQIMSEKSHSIIFWATIGQEKKVNYNHADVTI